MAKSNTFQTVTLKPVVGLLDLRSSVDEMPVGSFRHKLNFAINPDGKLSRALGWVRPFISQCQYENHDWHDQGVPIADREPITMFFPSTENDGDRRLFLGTKTRLAVLDEAAGDWTVLAGGPFGADGVDSLTQLRWHTAELQNHVYFTNGFDRVQYHLLGSTTVQDVPELLTAGEGGGEVTKARVIISWSGLIFLMNVVEDGISYPSRIRWSDLNNGLAWTIGTPISSITEYQDLDYGEAILAALPLAGNLYVFTDKSIWKCTPNIDVATPAMELSCIKVYTEPRNRAKCLAYPNAIISTGFEIYYMGSDGVYKYTPYLSEPERVEWIHRATSIIYKDAGTAIDKQACQSPIMEYVPGPNENETAGSGELHISWPVYDPLAVEVGGAGAPESIDCSVFVPTPQPAGSGINRHTLVLNLKHSTADYRDYGSTAMVNFTSQLLAGACAQQAMFLAANGADFTIKLMNTGQSREYYSAATDSYSVTGYYSRLRFLFPFASFDAEKIIKSFAADLTPDNQDDTAIATLRIATADRALDPNLVNGRCQVLWHQLSSKPIKCSYLKTAAQYVTANVRPNSLPVAWEFLYRGKFLIAELTIKASNGTAPTTGGCSISRFEVDVKLA